jgi:twitching motility protein PilT
MQLYRENRITYEEALRNSSNPSEFDLRVRGIEATSDKTWDFFEGHGPEKETPAAGSLPTQERERP